MLFVVADEPAVDEVGAAGDVGAFFGGEEGYDAGYIVYGAEAAEGDVVEQGVELGLVGQERGVDRGVDGRRGLRC